MATTNGKVVGARLPIPDYLLVIAAAAELKMTVSDYVIYKLFAPPDPSVQLLAQAKNQLAQLSTEVAQLQKDKAELTNKALAWQKHGNTLEQTQQAATAQVERYKQQLQQAQNELAQQRAQLSTSTGQVNSAEQKRVAAEKRLANLRNELADMHDESGLLGGIPEKYWAIIDRYIPPQS